MCAGCQVPQSWCLSLEIRLPLFWGWKKMVHWSQSLRWWDTHDRLRLSMLILLIHVSPLFYCYSLEHGSWILFLFFIFINPFLHPYYDIKQSIILKPLFHIQYLIYYITECIVNTVGLPDVIATGARDGSVIIWDKRCKPHHRADEIAPAHHSLSECLL